MARTKKLTEIKGANLVWSYIALFLMMIGVLELVPLVNLIFYPEESSDLFYWLIPGLTAICIGAAGALPLMKHPKGDLTKMEGLSLVLAVWILAIFMFAIPWIISGQMDFTRAVFECTSGFTTTGMTTCDIANTSHSFLFSRSLMTWSGGAGLVLILTAAVSDKARTSIYSIEGHNDKLLPNIAKSARTIFLIYFILTILGTLALKIAGLPWFDSINICMASISTGGFAVDSSSLVCYDNIAAEIIVALLAALGASSFMFHYFVAKRQFKKAFLNYEFIVSVIIFIVFGSLMVVGFTIQEGNFGLGLRYGLFQYFTAMTGAGFVNTSTPMMNLRPMLIVLTIIVMAIGGQSGSTAGGIKHFRLAYIFIGFKESLKSKVVSNHLIRTSFVHKYGQKVKVTEEDTFDATTYALLYFVVAFVGAFCISLFKDENGQNYGVLESFFEFLSCLGTTGLSSGITNANTAKGVLWIESAGMFFGRLELTILYLYVYCAVTNFVSLHNQSAKSAKINEVAFQICR